MKTINQLRNEKGITQKELEKLTGIKQYLISQYESKQLKFLNRILMKLNLMFQNMIKDNEQVKNTRKKKIKLTNL